MTELLDEEANGELARVRARIHNMADRQHAASLKINELEVRMVGLEKRVEILATCDQVRGTEQMIVGRLTSLEVSTAEKIQNVLSTVETKNAYLLDMVRPLQETVRKVAWIIVSAVIVGLLALVLKG